MMKACSNVQRDNEVDLIALLIDLWAQKLLIIGVAALVAILAFAYAHFSIVTPMYEAKIYLLPPTQNAISGFNSGRSQDDHILKPLTTKGVFTAFTKTLESESLHQKFFNEVYLPSLPEAPSKTSLDQLYREFSNRLLISSDKGIPKRYTVAFQGPDLERATMWVKAYAERANEAAKLELISNVERDASIQADDVEEKIRVLRKVALLAREDRISRLSEAFHISESIGLTSPQLPSNALITIAGASDDPLAYLRGSKALAAEIKILKARDSDDAFIPGLRELQAKHKFLRGLTVDSGSVAVSRQDGSVEAPNAPMKTKKKVIVLGGILVGLALGIFIALARVFFLRYIGARKPGV
jgi:chain length determinant protein (polysaccharide antigen chain regulator)